MLRHKFGAETPFCRCRANFVLTSSDVAGGEGGPDGGATLPVNAANSPDTADAALGRPPSVLSCSPFN